MTRLAPGLLVLAVAALSACSSTDPSGSGNSTANTGNSTTNSQTCINAGTSSQGNQISCAAAIHVIDNVDSKELYDSSGPVSVKVGTKDGDLTNLEFTVTNGASTVSAARLQIASITIDYEAKSPKEDKDSGSLAYECYAEDLTTLCGKVNGSWPAVVPAGMADNKSSVDAVKFYVQYKRFDALDRSAVVHIKLAGDPKYRDKSFDFALQTKLGKPSISVPGELDWSFVPPKQSVSNLLKVVNSGDAPLNLKVIDFTGSEGFSFTLDDDKAQTKHLPGSKYTPDAPIVVPVGGTISLHVSFAPADDKPKSGELVFYSDDPATSANGAKTTLKANSSVPCMILNPPTAINFGGVKVGGSQSKTLEISNTCTAKLIISSISADDGTNSSEFSIDWQAAVKAATILDASNAAIVVDANDPTIGGPTAKNPLTIPPNQKLILSITYTPSDVTAKNPNNVDKSGNITNPDTYKLKLTGNDFTSPHSVTITGIGVESTCPEAKVSVKEGEEVVPQTQLHLKGDASSSPGGVIKKYKWTVTQPPGSNQPLQPNFAFPNPYIQANTAGEYTFCLDVWDSNDVQSCAPGCVTVTVVPNNAIHVELLWDTPGDPDQTDTGPMAGADLDLHFANELATGLDIDCDGTGDPWFNNPFDCFWFTPNPKWGSSMSTGNSPSLDLDDTDGAGPENLNLQEPEGTENLPAYYSVGVHYWNDHGFGPSNATVTIFLQGVAAVKFSDTPMNPLDMWYVGQINWPNKLVGGKLPPVKPCLQTGDACLGLTDPTNPKAGKMWDANGQDFCITHCYLSQAFVSSVGGGSAANPNCKP